MKAAASAPRATTAPPIQTAVDVPLVNVSGELYPPAWAKTVANTATPKTPPTSRIAFVAPDALPSCSGETELRTTLATGAKKSAMPVPERMNGRTSEEYGVVGELTAAIQASPDACKASPTAMKRQPPI